MTMQH